MPERRPDGPAPAVPALQPTRDPRATLDDLLEVVLNKGAVLHLDLIIAVAGIPLIGVNVRAAIAGMETMLEYGMLRQWDAGTRARAARSRPGGLELRDGEKLVTRMFGGHRLTGEEGICPGWRPGTLYLTDRRLAVLRREPRELLWQAELADIRTAVLESERVAGGEDRTRLRVRLRDGADALLSAAEPHRLHGLLLRHAPEAAGAESADGRPDAPGGHQGHLWYHEPRRSGPLWRGGRGTAGPGGLTWKSPVDARPALSLAPADVLGLRLEDRSNPSSSPCALVLDTRHGETVLAADEPPDWTGHLHRMARGGGGRQDGRPAPRRRNPDGAHR